MSHSRIVSRLPYLSALTALALATGAAGQGGAVIQTQYYAYGAKYGDAVTYKVTKTRTEAGKFGNYFIYYSDRGHLTFRYISPGSWTHSGLSLHPLIHNGMALNLMSAGRFASVQINPATNMPGFDATHIHVTNKQIQIDWQDLSFSPTTIVRLDIFVRPTAAQPAMPAAAASTTALPHPAGSTPP